MSLDLVQKFGLTKQQYNLLIHFEELIFDWNKKINLISRKDINNFKEYFIDNPENMIKLDAMEYPVDKSLRDVIKSLNINEKEILLNRYPESHSQELEKIITPYNLGIVLTDVNFKDARPPAEVKDAFDDAIAAQEDEERFIREAEAYQREIEPTARGRVTRMTQEAEAYKERVTLEAQGEIARFERLLPEYQAAQEVTRQRLYIEAMEEVLGSTSKVLVDVKGGNNMMYLPLDKIIQQSSSFNSPAKQRNDVDNLRQQLGTTQNSQLNSSNDRYSNDRYNSGRYNQ